MPLSPQLLLDVAAEARDVLREPRVLLRTRRVLDPRRPRMLVDLATAAVPADPAASARCFLPPGYRVRQDPAPFADGPSERTFQPDVYALALLLARRHGSGAIVDVGCGTGDKLAALAGELPVVVGIDRPPIVASARARHPLAGHWLEHDLDADDGPLPVPGDAGRSIVVCADVIEHVRDPRRLLDKLRAALDQADALLLSTPDRSRRRGSHEQGGPPPNRAHAREWSLPELAALLRDAGFARGRVGLTRAHDQSPRRSTILAVCLPSQ
jgi:SAM-dependent methyltransferase